MQVNVFSIQMYFQYFFKKNLEKSNARIEYFYRKCCILKCEITPREKSWSSKILLYTSVDNVDITIMYSGVREEYIIIYPYIFKDSAPDESFNCVFSIILFSVDFSAYRIFSIMWYW